MKDNDKQNNQVVQTKAGVVKTKISGLKVFTFIVAPLLLAGLISMLLQGEPKTFYSFLLTLQDVPAVDYNWLTFETVAIEFPYWLEWLNSVFNFFLELVEVVGFFLAGIRQAILFLLYFLRWIFL